MTTSETGSLTREDVRRFILRVAREYPYGISDRALQEVRNGGNEQSSHSKEVALELRRGNAEKVTVLFVDQNIDEAGESLFDAAVVKGMKADPSTVGLVRHLPTPSFLSQMKSLKVVVACGGEVLRIEAVRVFEGVSFSSAASDAKLKRQLWEVIQEVLGAL